MGHAAPEGRVVVEKDGVVHGGVRAELEGQLENVHGVRVWWRKVASRPGTPTLR